MRVGDSAAGAVKSGGTTRRAAKMVIVDVDHPDIEDFVGWKIKEENKVAALVTGSKVYGAALAAHCARLLGPRRRQAPNLIPRKTSHSKLAVRAAKAACVPEASIKRAIDFAAQGYREIEVDQL